ncbi:MAG: hypothetical protein WCG27_00525 [Pseudomonadota bacterium]
MLSFLLKVLAIFVLAMIFQGIFRLVKILFWVKKNLPPRQEQEPRPGPAPSARSGENKSAIEAEYRVLSEDDQKHQ